ncbi:MAG: M15 family metallopeptidase [Labilithrix sp.]|nr:M15 family metallopeptidase [Labilithrix sp.]
MNRVKALRVASLTLVLTLAGCAASDGVVDADEITPEEQAEGAAFAGDVEDGAEPTTLFEDPLTTPLEDSAPFLDADDPRLLVPEELRAPVEVDPDSLDQVKACQRANGYRSGRKFTICVTKVDGKYVEVNTARAFLRMRKAARAKGIAIRVVSGFRTMAEQRYLYNCYKTKRCNGGNLAAPPGYSNHQSGKALDLNTSTRGVYGFLASRARSYGFRRTVASEPWHWER